MEQTGEINDQKTQEMAEEILGIEEYYCAEDFGNFLSLQTMVQTNFASNTLIFINKNKKITPTTIRASFLVDKKPKEVFVEKKIVIKFYKICKIYSEDNKFIKILINRTEKYDANEILKKMNENRIFKGAINANLKILEYPIQTYCLEEKKIQNIDNNIDGKDEREKEFILKKIKNNPNNLNKNTILNLNNYFKNNGETSMGLNKLNSNNQKQILQGLSGNTYTCYNYNPNKNNNLNNENKINNNNIQTNNCNMNQSNTNFNRGIVNQNFYNNINNLNNNMNLMNNNNNIIQNFVDNNKCLLNEIVNYLQQNNNNAMNKNLLEMINTLIQINNNIPINFINIPSLYQNTWFVLNYLNQSCSNNMNKMDKNNMNKINNNNSNQTNNNGMNQMNNDNQMSIYFQPIINWLNQINNNIQNLFNLFFYQNNNNNCINNNLFDNKDNNNNINKKPEENEIDVMNFIIKEFENYFPLIGLRNVGLTCYMNSILQCLLHIPELNGFFINKYPEEKDRLKKINDDTETGGRLCEEYHKVVISIKKVQGKNYIIPKDFNNLLSNINGQFAQYEANDAKDLLLYLFQAMHSELNYNGDQKLKNVPKCNQLIEKESFDFFITVNQNLNLSIISYLFYGVHKSTTICKGCKNTLYNFQYFQFLSFPTFNYKNDKFNIYKGFKEFIKPEIMSGENQCYCQNCKGLRDAKVITKIYFTPPYLIINIDYGKDKKYMPRKVTFGGIIDIKEFVDEYNKSTSILYKLIAVSTHIGHSGRSGHYVTYCQNNKDKWYEFNDSSVTETKFEELNNNSPYVLVYKKL